MQEVKSYPNATFSWIDLVTTDADAAKTFYTQLFGWTYEDMPAGEAGIYTMLKLEGHDVAALSDMSPEQADNMPPHWNSYVSVDDLDGMATKVTEAGGTLMMPPFDVMDAGRMAVVQDPTGAVFCLWEAKNHIGARLVNIPSTLCWNELSTRDAATAGAFYATVFGWDIYTDEPSGYRMFQNNGRNAAGMLEMNEEWGDIPPHWMVYFAVADCDASIAKAVELGAKLSVPATDIPGTGRFCVIQDPQGAAFSMIQMEQMEPPPSG